MTDFTPAQLACIEQHRYSDDTHWADDIIAQFVAILAAFGIDVDTESRRVRYMSGKEATINEPVVSWDVSYCQGSGAQFAAKLNLAEFLSKGRAAITAPEVPDPDGPTNYAYLLQEDCTHELGKMLVTQLQHWEGILLAYQMHPKLWEIVENTTITCTISSSRYNHSGAMSVEVECDENAIEYPDEDTVRTLYNAAHTMCAAIADNDDWQDFLRSLADQLYSELEDEYEYQTSDEAVWEAIEANGLFTPEDEDDESEDEDHPAAQAA